MCAKQSNVGTRVWLDRYELSGMLNAANQQVEQVNVTANTFLDVGPRRVVDTYDHKHTHGGLFDAAADALDPVLWALLGDDGYHYLCQLFGSSVEGAVAYEAVVKLAGQPRKAQKAGLVLLDTAFEGAEGLSRGVIHANRTITGLVTMTGRNQGATVAGQVYQTVIRVFSATVTTFTVVIEQSTDDGSVDPYAAIAGLSQVITGPGVWRLTTTAATETWKRARVSAWTGTTALVAITGGVVAGS